MNKFKVISYNLLLLSDKPGIKFYPNGKRTFAICFLLFFNNTPPNGDRDRCGSDYITPL